MLNLLKIGLVIIPFYELIVRCFPSAYVLAVDTRGPKLALSLLVAAGIGVISLYQGKIKKFSNKGILAFIVYAFMCMQFAPNVPLFINENDSSMFWMWKPMVIILSYGFLILAIANIQLSKKDIIQVLKIMAVCGAVMSVYIFIQKLGLDQFFFPKTDQRVTGVTNQVLAGSLGQPTVVSSFLAIVLPIALCVNMPVCSITIALALILANSKVALVSAVMGVFSYAILAKSKILLLILTLIFLGSMVFMSTHLTKLKSEWDDNGRIGQWKHIMIFWKTPLKINGVQSMHTITGFGPGSYEYLYPISRSSAFYHPHNEYIYILFNFGIIGLGIILYSIFQMMKIYWQSKRHVLAKGILSGFITALVCSLGTFILGLGTHSIYLATIVGLLHNNTFLQGGSDDS
jgi:hypothetical protein